MKVCFISHSSAKGGAERALLELIDALIAQGVKAYVLLPSHGSLIEEFESRRIAYQVIPYKWWMGKNSPIWKRIGRSILNLGMVIPIAIKLKQWKYDIIYTNTITVCIGAFVAKMLRLPHVWHIHEFGYEDHGLTFDLGQKLSLWLMDRLSTVCIANSYAVAKKYQQYIEASKVRVVYQSVSVPQDVLIQKGAMTQDTEIRCVAVGSLQEGKNQEDAIRAIGELLRMGIRVELLVVGDGDPKYRRYLHDLIVKNKLGNHVKFVGYVENPLLFMQMADVVLMCSRCEAFGRVTVEAMKAGKLVIGARSGGTIELIREGFNGLLYAPGNYKELAEKIKYLYENPDIARLMGRNGQRWALERFTKDRFSDEVLAILKQLIDTRCGRQVI
jgi:glycosyltransferase involved in cell wall biosynthesis